ncbi:tetratricopeptide repeat protein [Calditerrivibrio nitroreducens]|uniref:Tetratricopeptide TPR_1 repeat-containing protein n=1 Tax=Calditerrivibrio nitroreducens (strain DSM 19672 / NBRC 101217 / Yu37-1) TaxID=768670 RepID=E4TFZ7_CALNY|nr:hypothetical protein [Calditerrivibrio nitroreducens]ADR18547.1 hypothetical protein Calni_0635 [Calditerrivibrio nitroreducens DSM 19672]
MKKNFLYLLVLIFSFAVDGHSRIKLPEFSFIGKEIGKTTVKPSFVDINIKFKAESSVNIYLEKLKIEHQKIDKNEYSFEEPGFFFGGTVRTALASIFVGNKAYRNYIAKKFFQKEYLYVVDGYEKYSEKLKGGDFETEIKLFYAIALMETSNPNRAVEILEELSFNNDNVSFFAQDKLFEYLNKTDSLEKKIAICGKLSNFTEYSLNSCLDAYYKKDLYDEIIAISDKKSDLIDKNKQLLVYKIAAQYAKGDLNNVAKYDPDTYKDVVAYIADANLEKGELNKAESMINRIEQKEVKDFYQLKLAIIKKDTSFIKSNLNNITTDNNKLFLVLYYISKNFDNLDIELLKNLKFEKPVYYDYINFYIGLYLVKEKEYMEASTYLNKISFYEELIQNSIFYLGVCYYYTDYGLSDIFFNRYLGIGKDPEKLNIARYMIAQFLFVDKKYDDALKSLDKCEMIQCNELKAEIYFNKGDYNKAASVATFVITDRGFLIAASSLFNLKNYEGALQYLNKIQNATRESNFLKMLTYFKLGEIPKGLDIYKKYNYDREFTENAVSYLYLGNYYSEVINILKTKDKITAEQELMLANSYFSIGNHNESVKRYFDLIDKKVYVYESAMAIFSIAQQHKDMKMLGNILSKVSNLKFENKDTLLLSMIRYLFENGDKKIALEQINKFLKSFPTSNYLKDAYILRGYINESLGFLDDCIKDADRVIDYNPKDEEAYYIKAICSKKINKGTSLKIFEDLANKSVRFKEVSLKEIVSLSDDPAQISNYLPQVKSIDILLYYKTLVRMLGLLEVRKDFPEYDKYIDELIASRDESFVPAGYYYKSVLMYTKNDSKTALNYAMRCHYLFPKSPFTYKALQLAMQIYKKNNDQESAKKVEDIIKNYDKGGN